MVGISVSEMPFHSVFFKPLYPKLEWIWLNPGGCQSHALKDKNQVRRKKIWNCINWWHKVSTPMLLVCKKWVLMSQTCFQRGLLKEIFFKFYKVQPLIMLSHNQSLQSITVSSLQVISSIWYDYGVFVFWSVQYGSCHRNYLFINWFFFSQNVCGSYPGTLHNLFFSPHVFQICYC